MKEKNPKLLLHTSPYLHDAVTTPRVMFDVVLSLCPVVAAAIWFFGLSAILIILSAMAGAVLTEWMFSPGKPRGHSLKDFSGPLTGLLLALTLPPGLPLWMAFLGGVVGIGMGKLVWGGMGHNLFNPALVGRAFLQAAFPTALTTCAPQGSLLDFFTLRGNNLALPFMQGGVDALSSATPLAQMKFSQLDTSLWALLFGNTSGSLGETCAGLILLSGLWLACRRTFDWRIPVSIFVSVALVSTVIYFTLPGKFPSPFFMLFSGGLAFGAIFMATDPVSSPLTPLGSWIFGFGIGALVVLIRLFGGLPEGVMYSILLMNAATPLIERKAQPRVLGRRRGG
jgi:electron transport complex protein RnfD